VPQGLDFFGCPGFGCDFFAARASQEDTNEAQFFGIGGFK
jgi:hypothetical protein